MPSKLGARLRKMKTQTFHDLSQLFKTLDADGSGFLDQREVGQAATMLGFPFETDAALASAFAKLDADGNGKVSEAEFIAWWNSRDDSDELFQKFNAELSGGGADWEG